MNKETIYETLKKIVLSDKVFSISAVNLRLMGFNVKLMNVFKLYHDDKEMKMRNIEEIFGLINQYLGVSEVEKKLNGEVFTPFRVINGMLDKLPQWVWSDPTLKWLDPANGVGNFPAVICQRLMVGLKDFEPDGEKRYKHIMENMIYICDISPKNMFLYNGIFDIDNEYKLNTYRGSFLDEGFDNHMKNVWGIEGFNITTSNPPYNQSIDLKFLEKGHNLSDILLFVHPSTWILDEKGKQNKFIKARETVRETLKSVRLFNGNGVFGISLFVPCMVTYCNKLIGGDIVVRDEINDKTITYDNIDNINKYNTEEYLTIKEKVSQHGDYISEHLDRELNYWVNLAQISGNHSKDGKKLYKDDFYILITKNKTVQVSKVSENTKNQFSFETETEANNFLNYTKTKFVRFCLSIYKNNANCHRGEIGLIPWLDFTEEWDDNRLKEHFNITDKEWEFIESVIPDYY